MFPVVAQSKAEVRSTDKSCRQMCLVGCNILFQTGSNILLELFFYQIKIECQRHGCLSLAHETAGQGHVFPAESGKHLLPKLAVKDLIFLKP